LAGTETQGLWRSDDAGGHWRRVGAGALAASISQIVVGPEFMRRPQLLALHEGRLSRSEDGGGTWQPLPAAALDGEAASALLAPASLDAGGRVLVALDSGRATWVKG
jgi:hypothetical protein